MKRLLICLLFGLLCCGLHAQFYSNGESDLAKRNLKGPVVRVIEESYGINEAFGEWKRGKGRISRLSVFNDEGFYLLDTEDNRVFDEDKKYDYIVEIGTYLPVITNIILYRYDEEKVLQKAVQVYSSGTYALKEYEDTKHWLHDNLGMYLVYEYNTDGRLSSITGYDPADDIVFKDVYKYNEDGFEVWYYNSNGRRDNHKSYKTINSKRMIIKTDGGRVWGEVYNEAGQLAETFDYINLSNGEYKGSVYYSYNEHGDLEMSSSDGEATKSITGIEALYPIIKEKHLALDTSYYDYKYDTHGNWVIRKRYQLKNDEVVITQWTERKITYAKEGFDADEYIHSLVN